MPARPCVRRSALALVVSLAFAVAGCDRGAAHDDLGRPAPQIVVNDGQSSVNLKDLRGHVVLLNFWATWCGPCLAEIPELQDLQRQIPDLKLVAIAFDEDVPTYQAYLQRHPVAYFTVLDTDGTAHTRFGTFRPPESYLIDKKGIIRQKFISGQDWTSPEILSTIQQMIAG